jgi:hypothetical protein
MSTSGSETLSSTHTHYLQLPSLPLFATEVGLEEGLEWALRSLETSEEES